jgi:hypothetical protein
MSKEMAVIAFGIWVAVIPYLGIPGSWRTILLVLTGFAIIALGFFLRAEMLSRGGRRNQHHSFVENSAAAEPQYANDHKERIHSLN